MLDPERSLASTDGRRRGEGKRNRASITSHPPDERDWIDDPLLHTKHMSASASVRPIGRLSSASPKTSAQTQPAAASNPTHGQTHATRAAYRSVAGSAKAIQYSQPKGTGRGSDSGRPARRQKRAIPRPGRRATLRSPSVPVHAPLLAPPRPGRKAAGRTTRILLDRARSAVRRGGARANGEIDRRGERKAPADCAALGCINACLGSCFTAADDGN